jgi:hypothetical protein
MTRITRITRITRRERSRAFKTAYAKIEKESRFLLMHEFLFVKYRCLLSYRRSDAVIQFSYHLALQSINISHC